MITTSTQIFLLNKNENYCNCFVKSNQNYQSHIKELLDYDIISHYLVLKYTFSVLVTI